jgi:5'-3' exonuclease
MISIKNLLTTQKVVFVDFSVFMFRAIHIGKLSNKMYPPYNAMSMIIACLTRLELKKDDIVIFALDRGPYWRKKEEEKYKANRVYDDWWKQQFKEFDKLKTILNYTTPFHIIEIKTLEADDIISYGVRYYKDKMCIIVSHDSDMEQLLSLPNVKIFSPLSKTFKEVNNPYETLVKKIEEEKTDNLIKPLETDEDFVKRNRLVNLLSLPIEIEMQVEYALNNLDFHKKYYLKDFLFKKLVPRINSIFERKTKKSSKEIEETLFL